MFFNRWMTKQWYIHTMEYYSAIKKEQTVNTSNGLDEFQGHCAEWKNPIPKGYILCDSIYIIFLKWWNYRNGEQISGWHGLRAGRLQSTGSQRVRHDWATSLHFFTSAVLTSHKIVPNMLPDKQDCRASLVAELVKNPLEMRETWVQSLGWEDPLEKFFFF